MKMAYCEPKTLFSVIEAYLLNSSDTLTKIRFRVSNCMWKLEYNK